MVEMRFVVFVACVFSGRFSFFVEFVVCLFCFLCCCCDCFLLLLLLFLVVRLGVAVH